MHITGSINSQIGRPNPRVIAKAGVDCRSDLMVKRRAAGTNKRSLGAIDRAAEQRRMRGIDINGAISDANKEAVSHRACLYQSLCGAVGCRIGG